MLVFGFNICEGYTVDGRNAAPVDRQFIPFFTRFYTSQVVVWDFFHQPHDWHCAMCFFFTSTYLFVRDSRKRPTSDSMRLEEGLSIGRPRRITSKIKRKRLGWFVSYNYMQIYTIFSV